MPTMPVMPRQDDDEHDDEDPDEPPDDAHRVSLPDGDPGRNPRTALEVAPASGVEHRPEPCFDRATEDRVTEDEIGQPDPQVGDDDSAGRPAVRSPRTMASPIVVVGSG